MISQLFDVAAIMRLQEKLIAEWHVREMTIPYSGLDGVIAEQLKFNFLLWHEEDKARSPTASDAEIAQVKRSIDRLNQQRNDWIERLDQWIAEDLTAQGVVAPADAPLNTETLGSTVDRLGILALRIYHLREQLERPETTDEQRDVARHKLHRALTQQNDLSQAAQQLADDIYAARKRHHLYRQLKLYNDPLHNPYLFKRRS